MIKTKNLKEEVITLKKKLKDEEWAGEKTKENIKILYKELEEKNKKLKELDRLKSQFVANVAHEFKSPLIIIREAVKLILDGTLGEVNDVQRDALLRGRRNAERLIRLVTDLLDLAKIEAGKLSMKRERVDVALLIEEVSAAYKNEFSKKGITFIKNIREDIGLIWADKDKINEVIVNLLNNAIKYTRDGGTITINLTGDEREIRFEVTDTGLGISKGDTQRIFDKFERIGIDKKEGTGLGLPITKDIVELHKGKIRVESKVGKGSKFIFTLPRDLRKKDRV